MKLKYSRELNDIPGISIILILKLSGIKKGQIKGVQGNKAGIYDVVESTPAST